VHVEGVLGTLPGPVDTDDATTQIIPSNGDYAFFGTTPGAGTNVGSEPTTPSGDLDDRF